MEFGPEREALEWGGSEVCLSIELRGYASKSLPPWPQAVLICKIEAILMGTVCGYY